MRAAVFEGVGRPLVVTTLPDPTPAADEVVIRVGRCGICGTDLHMTEGHGPSYPPGTVAGHEVAGEVVAIGREVTGLKPGDRVAAHSIFGCGRCAACAAGDPFACPGMRGLSGGFGEFTATAARACLKLPDTLSLADGALVEPLACSLHGVVAAGRLEGARVLVLGAGAVGLGAVFWARRLGAGRIAVAAHSRRGEALAMTLGADAFVDPEADRAAAVTAALGGPPDIVFECVGRPGLLADAVALVRFRGTVVVLSMCMQPDTLMPGLGLMKELTLRFAVTYTLAEFGQAADMIDRDAVAARAMVTGLVPLAELPAAFEALCAGSRHCKLMVDPGA